MKDTHIYTQDLFLDLFSGKKIEGLKILVVVHCVSATKLFLNGLSLIGDIEKIFIKPKSIIEDERNEVAASYETQVLDRNCFKDRGYISKLFENLTGERYVVLDIGGYFSYHTDVIMKILKDRMLGFVEDTENGHRRYSSNPNIGEISVLSVARSPLKVPEDYLVGINIVFSAETILRKYDSILNGRVATVFGFGKIGQSIASSLRGKGVNVTIVEVDPIRAMHAKAFGYPVITKEIALQTGNLIFCATGNKCIGIQDLKRINRGAYIISATSADDEFRFSGLHERAERVEVVSPNIEKISFNGNYFYLMNNGEAVNFLNQAKLGPFLAPLQAEIIQATYELSSTNLKCGLSEISDDARNKIASSWQEHFSSVSSFQVIS